MVFLGDGVAQIPMAALVAGLPVRAAMVASDTALARQQLLAGQAALAAAGVEAETELIAGEPRQVLPELVRRRVPALLVMGAFGHSRLRQRLFGSTTTSLLRLSSLPVLILR